MWNLNMFACFDCPFIGPYHLTQVSEYCLSCTLKCAEMIIVQTENVFV